ncbi:MAG: aromatic ring-hydroxylating dioxygenase subunit alpha [Goleter apudmare HA4340-LM2]|jgi:phenylpropionate dioxygenase-like ring-hydroxylating dioxygenase large terminal subunit|nr:aromatic ring-hydroxylating dioxygenase subunit alpha [Goleter apudmare HA4340-LM2]
MNLNSQNINSSRKPKNFNNPERFIEGWYWAIPAHELSVGEVKSVNILGRELVIFRGKDRKAVTFDAYCPHMGAHLAEGKVEGNELRCFFHHWKFDGGGFCVDIPCLDKPLPIKLKAWPTGEKYGMIWVWTGEVPLQPLPFVPELEHKESRSAFGSHFFTNCHPHVVLINTIDAQHFNTVHKLVSTIVFAREELHQNAINFTNITPSCEDTLLIKLIRPFYKNSLTYSVCYWYGSIGTATFGPDFLHFHIMFAMRPLAEGKAEIQTLFIVKRYKGMNGWLYNQFVLWLTKIASEYFLKADIKIFQKIKFDLKTPINVDQSIVQFINHLERQNALSWGTWQPARSTRDEEVRENRDKWRDVLND